MKDMKSVLRAEIPNVQRARRWDFGPLYVSHTVMPFGTMWTVGTRFVFGIALSVTVQRANGLD